MRTSAEDHHHDVLGDADAVRVGDLGDGQAVLDRGLQVDVVGADAGGQRELQVRRARDPLGGQVGRPERLGDHDLGARQLALEDRVRAVLVGGDDQRVARRLQEVAQPQLARDAADQLARGEAERPRASARSGRRGSARSSGSRRAHRPAGSRRADRRRARRERSPSLTPSSMFARRAARGRRRDRAIMSERARERALGHTSRA